MNHTESHEATTGGHDGRPRSESSNYDSGSEEHRVKNAETRKERKRTWDDYNDDYMKVYMDELINKMSSSFKSQDEKFTKMVNNAVTEIKTQNEGVSSQLTSLNSSMTEIRSEINTIRNQYDAAMKAIGEVQNEQASLRLQFSGLSTAHEFNSKQQTDFNTRLQKVEKAAAIPEKNESELQSLRATINELNYEIHKHQQFERLLNLEISGVPEKKNENVVQLCLRIAKVAGVTLSEEDIVHATRIQPLISNPNKPKSIVMKLKNRTQKDSILAGLHKKRISTLDISMSGDSKEINVNEHLTVHNKHLFKKCRDVKKAKNYRYCWVKNCRIYLRKTDESPIIHIRNESDLLKLR